MDMDYEQWHRYAELIQTSQDRTRFWPRFDVDAARSSGDSQRKLAADIYDATKRIVVDLQAEKQRIAEDPKLTDEGKRDQIEKYFCDEFAPLVRSYRGESLTMLLETAGERKAAALARELPAPESAWEVALGVEALRLVRKREIKTPDLAGDALRAVVTAPPEMSGLNPEVHRRLHRRAATDGGQAISDAEAFNAEVQAVRTAIDMAEVAGELEIGKSRRHPAAVAGSKMRKDLGIEHSDEEIIHPAEPAGTGGK